MNSGAGVWRTSIAERAPPYTLISARREAGPPRGVCSRSSTGSASGPALRASDQKVVDLLSCFDLRYQPSRLLSAPGPGLARISRVSILGKDGGITAPWLCRSAPISPPGVLRSRTKAQLGQT